MPETPDPPVPFLPQTETAHAGMHVHRCHQLKYRPGQANPGPYGEGRFHFFGTPQVPALYFAQSPEAALCEKILRYTPAGAPSRLAPGSYRNEAVSELVLNRDLKMAVFHSGGLRALNVAANQLTDTNSDNYSQTRKWAEAAYAAGFDGVVWMSRQYNISRSWMVFGDRVAEADFTVESLMPLGAGAGFDWLVDVCGPMKVDVIPAV